MDPNLFHLDWERLMEVIFTIAVIAILVERALSIVFEHRLYIQIFNNRGLKEFISFGFAFIICLKWQFDVISIILSSEKSSSVGIIITALIIAGGSKGSVKIFRDLMKIKSSAFQEAEIKSAENR